MWLVPISSAANINSFMSILLRLVYNSTVYLIDGDVKEFLKMAIFPGGSVTQAAIDALNVVTRDPVTGAFEVAGTPVTVPIYTWGVNCPLPSSLVAGSVIGVSAASFGGTGKNTLPIYLISDGSSYRPFGRQILARQNGSEADPVSGVATNIVASTVCKFSQGTSYYVPADFLAVGWNIGIQAVGIRGTTVGGTALLRPGISTTDAMSGGATVFLAQNSLGTTASATWHCDVSGAIGTGGVITRNDLTTRIGLLSGGSGDNTITLGSVNYFNIGVTSATNGDDFALISYTFYIE